MRIKKIELNNFRIYKDKNIIDILPDSNRNIIIISGKNGYGKTTFLMALVWCLYGKQMQEVDVLYDKEISDQGGYSKYISNSLNRLAKLDGETKFSASIVFTDMNIPEVPCKEIKIIRSFDIESSSSEEIEILIDGHKNELTEEVGPEIFIRDFILPKEIAKFFLFDAEKIVSLAETNNLEQRKQLSHAYSEVLGIKKYEDLRRNLEYLQIRLRQQSASKEEKETLNNLNTEVQNLKLEIKDREEKISELKEQKSAYKFESNQIQEKLIREGNTITVEELNTFKEREEELTKELDEIQNELKNSFDIIPFAIAGEKILDVSIQLENEDNYKKMKYMQESIKEITDNILTDLITEQKQFEGIITPDIQEFYFNSIRKLIKKHFFADIQELPEGFEILHDFSDSQKNELNTLVTNIKYSFRESFKKINGDYNQTRNELSSIRRRIKDAESNQADPIISEYRIKKDELDKKIIEIEDSVESLNQKIGVDKNNVMQKERHISELSKKIEVSKENKDKDKTIKRLINELKEFIVNFKEQKKKSLEKNILNGLNTLMHMKLINKVEVEIIGDDININLYNKRKELIRKESLSKGQQQIYASALLKGLVEESNIEFPVFIDSPMQKFDEEHSQNIIKYFYPNVSDQVVIFPLINKELTIAEFNSLKSNISKTFLINNINNDKSEFLKTEPDEFIKKYKELYNNAD